MKLVASTILMLSMLVFSACQKNEGGGDSGGTPAAKPVDTSRPAPPAPPSGEHDNRGRPALGKRDQGLVQNRRFSNFNSDNITVNDCDTKQPGSRIMCYVENGKQMRRPIHFFSLTVTPQYYLSCLSGNSININLPSINFPNACEQDRQKTHSIFTRSNQPKSCFARSWIIDQQQQRAAVVESGFNFETDGRLTFWARINGFEYKGINISYEYNKRTRDLSISKFYARGNNPNLPYLAVASLSAIKGGRSVNANMLLKQANVLSYGSQAIGGVTDGFRFKEGVLLSLTQVDYSPSRVVNPAPGNPGSVPPGQLPPTWNQNPQSAASLLIIGGDARLYPVELLNSLDSSNLGTGLGNFDYVPYDDPRI